MPKTKFRSVAKQHLGMKLRNNGGDQILTLRTLGSYSELSKEPWGWPTGHS